jgi:hypothetical protein
MLLTLVFGPGSVFSVLAATQEVSGVIQGEVKDESGAVVANATITAKSEQRSYSATSNSDGLYRFNSLPPGVYTITATAAGFSTAQVNNVTVELGRTLSVVLEIKASGASESVTVTGTSEPIVDVTSTKVATNVTQAEIDVLPKTINFSSVINVAPGTRDERNGGGFQIDGASGSENRFVVDGLDVTRVFGGTLGSSKNIPYDFVKEVQIKSAGYEAEFGGATGGVVNVVTRSGSNDFHGEVRFDYSSDALRASDNPTQRRKLTDVSQVEYFFTPGGKEKSRFVAPTFAVGGPVLKNKLWFFTSYAPEFYTLQRRTDLISVVTGAPAETVLNTRQTTYKTRQDYFITRLDYTPYSKLQINGSFIDSGSNNRGLGGATFANGVPNASTTPGLQTTSLTTFNNTRFEFQGGYTPSWQAALNVVWTPTSHLVVSSRIGRNYLNDKGTNYDIPVNTVQPTIQTPCPTTKFSCVPGSTSAGNPIIATNNLTLFDITKRTNYNFDAAYITRLFGQQHVIKGGYQRSNLFNDILNERSGGFVNFFYDQSFNGQRGTFGYYETNIFGLAGQASSNNQALFIQDQWQIHPRVTLNIGLRSENEFLPAYPIDLSKHPGLDASELDNRGEKLVSFGWGDKLAPRLGGAWDVFGDGRLKAYASYSVFYDIMKYDLARGSGGGEFWIQTNFALDQLEFRGISPENHPGRQLSPGIDLRFPSIGGGFPPGIDPDLKPMREHEYTFGADYAASRDLLFSARFTRKILDRAIDDVGHLVAAGEEYTVGNPGFGIADSFYGAVKAVRNYSGLELRVDKRFSNNWYANLSYIYSRLYGNYGGLASSDEFGRANPNINRYFDNLALSYDNFGRVANGKLATDRPNTFKAFGSYRFNWLKRMSTDIGASQFVYQGTPNSTSVAIRIVDPAIGQTGSFGVFPNGRGDLGRTPWLTQTDLIINHRIRYDERVAFKFQLNVINLWDERNSIGFFTGGQGAQNLLAPGQFVAYKTPEAYINGNGDLFTKIDAGIKAGTLARDPRFNLPFQFQAPREARFAIGIEF